MTTLQLLNYYSSLLILQYLSKPNAVGTIQAVVQPVLMCQTSMQQIAFSSAPSSGSFSLSYNGNATSTIAWNASAATIQSDLQAVSGLSSVTVAGSIASGSLIVTFTGVTPPALSLVVLSNTLGVTVTITETDVTMPLAVQTAFNLLGSSPATGVQLDVLGKYAGVVRSGSGVNGQPITLNDTDFLSFIQMAIVTNSSGSSLYDIEQFLYLFFPNEILVYDYADMRMTYLISSVLGSQNLIQLFVTEGLLPKPMGVQVSIIYAPVINAFFGFRTYEAPAPSVVTPFNSYSNYNLTYPWLSYQDGFVE